MVSTDVSGIVTSVNVKEGQKVEAGQILFQIDPQQFKIAHQAAEANLAQTKISLDASEQDYQKMQSDIAAQKAQVSLAQTNNDRAIALLQNKAGTKFQR